MRTLIDGATSGDDPNQTDRIEHSDCLAFLRTIETGSVHLIATDPAYSGMNARLQLGTGRIVGRYDAKGSEEGRWFGEFEDTEENYEAFLSECARVLDPETGHLYLMFDSYSFLTLAPLVRGYFDVKNVIAWDKVNFGMGHYFRRQHELIIFATARNTRKLRHQAFPDVWRFKRIHRAAYPTQKPVELFQTMVHASAREGFTVCDPFVGSGSCAIAAIGAGCRFLGSDISQEAIDLTRSRVEHFRRTGEDPLQPRPASLRGDRVYWR